MPKSKSAKPAKPAKSAKAVKKTVKSAKAAKSVKKTAKSAKAAKDKAAQDKAAKAKAAQIAKADAAFLRAHAALLANPKARVKLPRIRGDELTPAERAAALASVRRKLRNKNPNGATIITMRESLAMAPPRKPGQMSAYEAFMRTGIPSLHHKARLWRAKLRRKKKAAAASGRGAEARE